MILMNSIDQDTAQQIIENIMGLLDDAYLSHQIDEPIYKASLSFKFELQEFSFQSFMQLITEFIDHIYVKGVYGADDCQSSRFYYNLESILADLHPQNPSEAIYFAYMDAITNQTRGIEFILSQIADSIVLKLRRNFFHYVLVTVIKPIDWHQRCAIAEILLKDFKEHFPDGLIEYTPARFAVPEMLIEMFQKLLNARKIATDPSSQVF